MLSLKISDGHPIQLDPELIESIEGVYLPDECVVTMMSGRQHVIARSFLYVTGVRRAHFERIEAEAGRKFQTNEAA